MKVQKKIEIKRIETGPEHSQYVLTLYDESRVFLVNIIPFEHSDEAGQDSEPFLAVHPDQQLIVCAAYLFSSTDRESSSQNSPLYLSADGGRSWVRTSIVPARTIHNQSYCFSGSGNKLYGAIMGTIAGSEDFGPVSILKTDDPTEGRPMQIISTLGSKEQSADQPFIQARAFTQDRIYVGQNYFGPELGAGKTASVRVSVDGGKIFRLLGLEARKTSGQDAPSVRPTLANDGTVYVAFIRWTSSSGDWGAGTLKCTGDVVITRDDEGGIGPRPFCSLVDPADGKPGRIVAQGRVFPFGIGVGGRSSKGSLGQQRIGSSLSLAVDPNNSDIVYIAWADLDSASRAYTIHVRKSADRGRNWSKDLLAIPSATNPAVAVSDDGVVGFLYQQLCAAGKSGERWETHFQSSPNGFSRWTDVTLATFPTSKAPKAAFQPYLGDKIHLLAVSNNFYGVFSALNIPERKYFPQGVRFQRGYNKGKLLSKDGKKKVPFSIDPYFFRISLKGDSTVSRTIDRYLDEKIGGPTLVNYTGFVTAKFLDKKGRVIQEIGPRGKCELRVRFAPGKEKESAEPIDIRGGEDAPQVDFKVWIDSGDLDVTPDSKGITMAPGETTELQFNVIAPSEAGRHVMFVQVFQRTRLIQVVAAKLVVRKRERE